MVRGRGRWGNEAESKENKGEKGGLAVAATRFWGRGGPGSIRPRPPYERGLVTQSDARLTPVRPARPAHAAPRTRSCSPQPLVWPPRSLVDPRLAPAALSPPARRSTRSTTPEPAGAPRAARRPRRSAQHAQHDAPSRSAQHAQHASRRNPRETPGRPPGPRAPGRARGLLAARRRARRKYFLRFVGSQRERDSVVATTTAFSSSPSWSR